MPTRFWAKNRKFVDLENKLINIYVKRNYVVIWRRYACAIIYERRQELIIGL
jgi:hypothetical protein